MATQFNTLCQETTLYEAWNTVKSKGSAGGVDGVTIEEFNKEKITLIRKLREDLIAGEWKPQPYLQISIPKTKDPSEKSQDLEVRNGLLTDNTRQLLVKSVMERLARYEKYQGQEIKMEQIILSQAKLLAKAFEGTDKFKPYVAKW